MDEKIIEGNMMNRKRPDARASLDHLITQTKKHKSVGNPDSGDNIVLLSPCWTRLSIKDVEEICNRRMQKLLMKQIRELNVFSRTERERMARLKQKHQLDCHGYQESGLRHEELQNLDNIFKQKVKEQNDLMDMKWKELHDRHLASIIKVQQWEDMSIAFLMKKNPKEPISLSAPEHPLNSELGSDINHMVGESVRLPPKAVQQSETHLFKGTEKGMIDGSSQNDDSRLPPDTAPIETEVLLIESDGEDDAASMPRAAPPNDVECNYPILVPENGASFCTSSHCERQAAPNREVEGNADHLSGLISRCLESDGENDITVMASGEPDANTKPLYDVSDVGTSEKNQLLSRQRDEETLLNRPATEVQDGNSNMVGSVDAPSREGLASPALATSSCVLEKIGACSTSGLALPLEKREMTSANLPDNEVWNVDYNEEPHAEASNREAEGRDATNLNTIHPQLNVENVPELPSSTLASGSCGVVQLRASTISGNLSPSDLPVHSTNLACNQITQTAAGLAVPNCEILGTSLFCLPNQSPELSVNLGSRERPMVQTFIMSPPVPSVLGQDQPYGSSCTTILRPTNNYFLGNSSLPHNTPLLIGSDSLLNELVRMEKEKEDVSKSYETEKKSLRIACEKDIKEIRKKYDLLLQDTENAFLMKKQDLESFKGKVSSHKLLADVLQVYQRQEPSREDLPNALHQLSILLHTSEQSTWPNTQHSAQPLQVHHLSDLIAVDEDQPQICSATNHTGNLLVDCSIQAQSLHLSSPLLPMHNISAPSHRMQNYPSLAPQVQGSTYFYGMQNQQILEPPRPQGSRPFLGTQCQQILAPPQPQGSLPGLCQRGYAPGHRVHLDGSQDNSVLLS